MIYLLLAIASSAMVSLIMRLSENYISGKRGLLAVNYVMCCGLSVLFAGNGTVFWVGEGMGTVLGMGAFNGILYLGGFMLLQTNVQKNGVVLSATFMKLGLLVPMALSVLFFQELPNLIQISGFLIAVVSILLINFEKGQSSVGFKMSLLLLLLVNGGADAMSKVFEEMGSAQQSGQFLFYTFLTAGILCFAYVIWKKERMGRAEVLFGLLIGIPNFFSAKFLLAALEKLKAVIVYPTYSVGTLLVVTLVGVCSFKEHLSKKQWFGLGLILISLILLNM
jgi:drug/metabolite transporter (DMT)-like permease